MINTNEKAGSKTSFGDVLQQELNRSTGVDIAVGFCGLSAVEAYRPSLLKVAKRGRVRFILGMYRVDGVMPPKLQAALLDLHQELTRIPARRQDGTGVYITTVDYHGKVYIFESGHVQNIWLESNNFSKEGLRDRLEAATRVTDASDKANIAAYVDRLCDPNCSVTIDKVLFTKKTPATSFKNLPYVRLPSKVTKVGEVHLKLRPSEQTQSCLNLCFGAGRKDKFGNYTPRPWYEVELSIPAEERASPYYPKPTEIPEGKKSVRVEFTAYLTHDGKTYRQTQLATYSDGNKALGSNPRTILGEFLKGTLEKAGVLRRGDLITNDVLDAYGNDSVLLTKLSDGSYILKF